MVKVVLVLMLIVVVIDIVVVVAACVTLRGQRAEGKRQAAESRVQGQGRETL
jgi:hypothetical protein